RDFLELDNKLLDEYQYIFCMPPVGTRTHDEGRVKKMLGDHGRELFNYLFVKLQHLKLLSKVAILVPPGFLFYSYWTKKIRQSILNQGILRGIIQLPPGILSPQTMIPMVLIVLDFRGANENLPNQDYIFLSQFPKTDYNRKLDSKILTEVLERFRDFEIGQR